MKYILKIMQFIVISNVSSSTISSSYGSLETVPDSLIAAAIEGDIKKVQQELSKPNSTINVQDKYGFTALHWAIQNNRPEIIALLLQQKNIDVTKEDNDGYTPIDSAIVNNNAQVIEQLLTLCEKSQNRPKCSLIEKRDKKEQYTPLMRAARAGFEDIVALLLAHGANPTINAKRDGELITAYDLVSAQHDNIRKLLNDAAKEYVRRSYAFVKALANDKLAQADSIFDEGIDVNILDLEGTPMLDWVIVEQDKDKVQKLLEAYVDVNVKNKMGMTPLQSAAWVGNKDIVSMLINAGAQVNTPGYQNRTALHWAADKGRKDIMDILIAAGADVEAQDSFGLSPLKYAQKRDQKEI